jgi:RNA polymerase sigma factor (TIGR02999 family)
VKPDISITKFEPGTDDLVVELYDELRRIARREHFRAGMPQTLQTTALVGETYFRLKRRGGWLERSHFLGCAATAMRHILVDDARARSSQKRSGAMVDLADDVPAAMKDEQVVLLGEALSRLAKVDEQLARIVECRFFAGYDDQETAEILGVTDRTVRRKWVRARAWIHAEMSEDMR